MQEQMSIDDIFCELNAEARKKLTDKQIIDNALKEHECSLEDVEYITKSKDYCHHWTLEFVWENGTYSQVYNGGLDSEENYEPFKNKPTGQYTKEEIGL